MHHEIYRSGPAFKLRPITIDDAASIIELRTDPGLSAYLHETSTDLVTQIRWLEQYLARDHDWYFAVERADGAAIEGLIGIYNFDEESSTAEWGRWIIRKASIAAVESVMHIYDICFDTLSLANVCCRTIADNRRVLAFHDSLGSQRVKTIPAGAHVRGQWYDVVEHSMTAERWQAVAPRVRQLASRAGGVVNRGTPSAS